LASLLHSHQIDQFGINLKVIIVHLHQICGLSKPLTFLDAPMDVMNNFSKEFHETVETHQPKITDVYG
jgi:hypothetical protein